MIATTIMSSMSVKPLRLRMLSMECLSELLCLASRPDRIGTVIAVTLSNARAKPRTC